MSLKPAILVAKPNRLGSFAGKPSPIYSHEQFIVWILVLCLLSGCASLGIRPNQPETMPSAHYEKRCNETGKDDAELKYACLDFYRFVEWGQGLSEAYRTRATWNEWALYAAGVVAVGAIGAAAGFAAFGAAASDGAKIVPLASGFVAGLSALFHNKDKAKGYTKAANDIDDGLSTALKAPPTDKKGFQSAIKALNETITKAKNALETSRSEAASTENLVEEAKKAAREEAKKVVDESKKKP